jgi:hypothetical protein
MSQVADHTGMLGEIRDALARPFGDAMGAHVPQVIDPGVAQSSIEGAIADVARGLGGSPEAPALRDAEH